MTGNSDAASLPFDVSKAYQARMYDYMLGGMDNHAADRAATEAAYQIWPGRAFAGADLLDREMLDSLEDAWRGKMQQQITWRDREQVLRFFAGTDLVAPGLVRAEEWRPDPGTGDGRRSAYWPAVGRKR